MNLAQFVISRSMSTIGYTLGKMPLSVVEFFFLCESAFGNVCLAQ
jgi:hypothetical protein